MNKFNCKPTIKSDPLIATHNDARRLMFWSLQDNPSVNLTQLAEDAAISLNHDEWLDDSDHWIWELAIEVFEKVNGEIL